ncbi:MAG: ribosomal protein S18-alanine N-acetyltransferase [Ruminococcus sp.]
MKQRADVMKKILFVCTGNTCRSPMAEAIFNKRARDKELDFTAESCGVCTVSGLSASANSAEACKEIGIDLSAFQSTDIGDLDLSEYCLIAVMSESHRQALISFGVPSDKICILAQQSGGISDPYGGSLERYRICRDEITEAVNELIKKLQGNVAVRKLDEQDAEKVHSLEEECFSKPWSEDSLLNLIKGENSALFGAFYEDRLVGFAVLEWVLDEGSLTNIAVDSDFRRQGIGEKLMEALINEAEEKKLAFITLEVRATNTPAIALYKKFGFEEVGRRKNYYSSPTEDALLMTKQPA